MDKRLRLQPAGLVVAGREAEEVVHAKSQDHTLAIGDRVAVFGGVDGGGIGIVKEIDGDEMYYTMFNPNVIYRKPIKSIQWNEQNWRWETTGLAHAQARAGRRPMPFVIILVVLAYRLGYRARRRGVQR